MKQQLSPSNKVVHGLWVGQALTTLEKLTIRSFLAHGHDFHLWAYDHVSGVPPGVVHRDAREILDSHRIFRYLDDDPKFGFGKGSVAGFSDIFRYRLLYEEGGWWSDMDVTCLRPLEYESPYVFRSHKRFPVVGNIMKCPPKSPLMAACYARASSEVDECNRDWVRPIRILCDEIERHELMHYVMPGFANPEVWKDILMRIVSDTPLHAGISVFHWCNEKWRSEGVERTEPIRCSTYAMLLEKFCVQTESHETKGQLVEAASQAV
jgi:hypothetical protein